jgi:hypothetical protein
MRCISKQHFKLLTTWLVSCCLLADVLGFNYTNRAAVVMWPQNNQANQRWVTDDRGRLRSAHNTNKCLDASAASNGAAVYIYDCHDGEGGWDK